MNERYRHLNKYLKEKFGERTLKICIDGGFTCPNRDGKLSYDGCIFCSQKGSGDHIKSELDITSQVTNYFNSYKASRANKFIVYFQNFTNTYDSIENLKKKYDSSLIDDRIVGLSIATRPDCISPEICQFLSSYKDKYYISVELGFQTANEETAKLINRQYLNDIFRNAVNLLNKYDIDVIVHLMVGLPNETLSDIEKTIGFINNCKINGIKIHSCYIIKNTKLCDLYNAGSYTPLTLDEYIELASYILTHISPDIVIHRISGDAPKDLLVAPEWNSHKKWIINGLDKYLRENDLWQGKYFYKCF